jgi:hypothetical protein
VAAPDGSTLRRRRFNLSFAVDSSGPRPWFIVAAALSAAAVGGLVLALFSNGTLLAALVAGATIAYSLFTVRLVRATEGQVKTLEAQILQEHTQWEEERDKASAERREALQVLRESVRSRRDALTPTVIVTRSTPRLFVRQLNSVGTPYLSGIGQGTLERLPSDVTVLVSMDFTVTNHGSTPAVVEFGRATHGNYEFEKGASELAVKRAVVINPGSQYQTTWQLEGDHSFWRVWTDPINWAGDEPPVASFEFKSFPPSLDSLDFHSLAGELLPFVKHPSGLEPQADSKVFLGSVAAHVVRSYPGLPGTTDELGEL